MKFIKKTAKTVAIILSPFIIIWAFIFYSVMGVYFFPAPEPVFTYGEFPFKLTYEINGEKKIVEDTIVCKFEGNILGGGSHIRQWKTTLKSGAEKIVLLDMSREGIRDSERRKVTTVFFRYGNAEYYMGDYDLTPFAPQKTDVIHYNCEKKDYENEVECETGYCTANEGVENFGIRLISFECAPPIENEFVYFGRIRGMARKMFVR